MSSGATPEAAVKVWLLSAPPSAAEPLASPGQRVTVQDPAQSREAPPSGRALAIRLGPWAASPVSVCFGLILGQ